MFSSKHTGWFDASTTEPGQPGVFQVLLEEINALTAVILDCPGINAYAYFDGKTFGPVRLSSTSAYTDRLQTNSYPGNIKAFRGLTFDAGQ